MRAKVWFLDGSAAIFDAPALDEESGNPYVPEIWDPILPGKGRVKLHYYGLQKGSQSAVIYYEVRDVTTQLN